MPRRACARAPPRHDPHHPSPPARHPAGRRQRRRGLPHRRVGHASTSTRAAARRCRASATGTPRCSRPCTRRSTGWPTRTPASSPPRPAEALADQLARTAPAGLGHVYFVSGGSEAIEAALKLARQYFVEIGEPERGVFIARRQSYHGNTLGALAVGGNEPRRRLYEPLLIDVQHVAPCYAYRDQTGGRDARGVRRPAGRRARGGDRGVRPEARHRVRRRNRRRRHPGRHDRRRPATSRPCARSAIGTACCSSSTR